MQAEIAAMEAQLQQADAVLAAGDGAAADGLAKLKHAAAACYWEDSSAWRARCIE